MFKIAARCCAIEIIHVILVNSIAWVRQQAFQFVATHYPVNFIMHNVTLALRDPSQTGCIKIYQGLQNANTLPALCESDVYTDIYLSSLSFYFMYVLAYAFIYMEISV